MKLILFALFLSITSWAKPTVLVSYFNAYGGAEINNSETVARLLGGSNGLPFKIKLCGLPTKFDVSYEELKNCLDALPETPLLVLGLGETGCDLKVEIMARNMDKTLGPDNAGIERKNTAIVNGAPLALGFTYPIAEMYCALEAAPRKEITISSDAGSFVCNNLAYLTTWNQTQLNFGFIHVPSHNCRNLPARNERVSSSLLAMINRAVEVQMETPVFPRLPVVREEFEIMRKDTSKDECVKKFWKSARAFDERMRWPF